MSLPKHLQKSRMKYVQEKYKYKKNFLSSKIIKHVTYKNHKMSERLTKLDPRIFPRDCYSDSDSDGDSTVDIPPDKFKYGCSPSATDCNDPLDPLGIIGCTSLTSLRVSPLTLPSSAIPLTSATTAPCISFNNVCDEFDSCIFLKSECKHDKDPNETFSNTNTTSLAPCQENMADILHDRLIDNNVEDEGIDVPKQQQQIIQNHNHTSHDPDSDYVCKEIIKQTYDNNNNRKEFVEAKHITIRSAISWFVGK